MRKAGGDTFFGWRVMWAAFVVAVFGWGVGFYGPPVFLHAIEQERGWPISLVSAAVTVHFLLGAATVGSLPAVYRRLGVSTVTKFSVAALAVGVAGWAVAWEPWHLFLATALSGVGWAGSGALAINMIVSPWFDRRRPAALSTAYNGASVGGILFSPLWIALIGGLGFVTAALVVGTLMVLILWFLCNRYFALLPEDLGTCPDGPAEAARRPRDEGPGWSSLPGRTLWRSHAFLTCCAGFTIGLFVQVGIIAHLVSLLVPAVGPAGAGLAAGLATACAILGRTLVGWFLPPGADRRRVAALTYLVQALGCAVFILAGGQSLPLLLLAVVLFGLGIGNVTSLPPLIAQVEFAPGDVARVIALCTAISQAGYAFAPAVFGLLREAAIGREGVTLFFGVAAALQCLAALVYVLGRRTRTLQSV